MGNVLLKKKSSKVHPIKCFEQYLFQTPDLYNKKLLDESKQNNKLFSTFQFTIHGNNKIIIKVYKNIQLTDLKIQAQNFQLYKQKLQIQKYPNLLAAQKILNFDKDKPEFVASCRQEVFTTLKDKLESSIPFLQYEKIWISSQIIIGLYGLHQENLFHGDLKTSNVLLTTRDFVYISDFAFYKPFHFKEGDQGRFNNFYKSQIAPPEKFYNESYKEEELANCINQDIQQLDSQTILKLQKMDMFQLGCSIILMSICFQFKLVLCQIWLDGCSLFQSYEQIQKFRKNQIYPIEILQKVQNEKIQSLILNLTDINPQQRFDINHVLQIWFNEIFIKNRNLLIFLYYISVGIQSKFYSNPDLRIGIIYQLLPLIYTQFIGEEFPVSQFTQHLPISIQNIQFLQILKDIFQQLNFNLYAILNITDQQPYIFNTEIICNSIQNEKFNQLQINGSQQIYEQYQALNKNFQIIKQNGKSEFIAILIQFITNNFRSLKFQQTVLVCIQLLMNFSKYIPDDIILKKVLPFLTYSFFEKSLIYEPLIIEKVFEAFCIVTSQLQHPFITNQDCILFQELIVNNIEQIFKLKWSYGNYQQTSKDMIQKSIVKFLPIIMEFTYRLMNEMFEKKLELNMTITEYNQQNNIDIQLDQLYNSLKRLFDQILIELLQQSSSEVQEVTVKQLPQILQQHFGKYFQSSNDNFLHCISFFNKPQQRLSFFKVIPKIIPLLSKQNLEILILNIDIRKGINIFLLDEDELIINEFINVIKEISSSKLIAKELDLKFLSQIAPLMLHPNKWISDNSIEFLSLLLKKYYEVQTLCQIQLIIDPFLENKILLNNDNLHYLLPKQLERHVIDTFKPQKSQECHAQQLQELKNNKNNQLLALYYEKYLWFYLDSQIQQLQINKRKKTEDTDDILQFKNDFQQIIVPMQKVKFSQFQIIKNITNNENSFNLLVTTINNFLIYLYISNANMVQFQNNNMNIILPQTKKQEEIKKMLDNVKIYYEANFKIDVQNSDDYQQFMEKVQLLKLIQLILQQQQFTNKNKHQKYQQTIMISQQDQFQDIDNYEKNEEHNSKLEASVKSPLKAQISQQQMEIFSFFDNSNYIFLQKQSINSLFVCNQLLFKSNQFTINEENVYLGKFSSSQQLNSPYQYQNQSVQNVITDQFRVGKELVATINDHKDVVPTLEILNFQESCFPRFFCSGSYDGTIKIYDIEQLENDFLSKFSIANIQQGEQNKLNKIKIIKQIGTTASLAIGTDQNKINVIRIDSQISSYQKQNNDQKSNNIEFANIKTITFSNQKAETQCIVPISNSALFSNNAVICVSSHGEILFEDLRCKTNAYHLNIGIERGTISSAILNQDQNSLYISTLNGYIISIDIRYNVITNIFKLHLNQKEKDSIPILCMNIFKNYLQFLPLNNQLSLSQVNIIKSGMQQNPQNYNNYYQSEFVAMGLASNNHEICIFDLNQLQSDFNPLIYIVSTQQANPTIHLPYITNVRKQEQFANYPNLFKDKYYNNQFIAKDYSQDILQFLSDPIMANQQQIKQQWLTKTQNCYQYITDLFDKTNSVHKILCFPQSHQLPQSSFQHSSPQILFNSSNQQLKQKYNISNILISAGNDCNIRFWPLNNSQFQDSQPLKLIKGYHISNIDGQDRIYQQTNKSDMYIIHEQNSINNPICDKLPGIPSYRNPQYILKNFQQSNASSSSTVLSKEQYQQEQFYHNCKSDYNAAHQDAILDMIFMERAQNNQGLLISAGRDNLIKIWK